MRLRHGRLNAPNGIVDGMAELDRWLGDLLRHGLGHAQSQPYTYWDAMRQGREPPW
jgi:hypothetical protein